MSFVITDLKAIKKLSEQNQEENFEFRSWLKFHSPKNLDKTVVVFSKKYFTHIDCKSCANCCCSLEFEIKQVGIERIAQETLSSSMEFQNKFFRKNAENATCLNLLAFFFLITNAQFIIHDHKYAETIHISKIKDFFLVY